MKITIRSAGPNDFAAVEQIMRQVQQLHVGWRPDLYRPCETAPPRLDTSAPAVLFYNGKQ